MEAQEHALPAEGAAGIDRDKAREQKEVDAGGAQLPARRDDGRHGDVHGTATRGDQNSRLTLADELGDDAAHHACTAVGNTAQDSSQKGGRSGQMDQGKKQACRFAKTGLGGGRARGEAAGAGATQL